MLHTRPFTRRIILLGVFPVFIAAVILGAGFVILQNQLVASLKNETAIMAKEAMLPLLKNPEHTQEELVSAAELLLNIETISHLSLYHTIPLRHANQQSAHHFSRPIKSAYKLDFLDTETSKTIANTVYTVIPYKINDQTSWLVVGILNGPFTIPRYQGAIILMAVAILVILMTLHFGSRLYNEVTTPLKEILNDLRQAISNHSEIPPINSKNQLYNELILALNEMIAMQQSIHEEMQNNVDQSTKELRETLETVEIQNIELDIARKNALQASRAKSEFLANASHELRTPLNGILGFTSLLLKTNISNQQKDYLSTIEQSAQGLLTVINDILDFSKLETGQLSLEYKPVYLRELIEEVFAIYAPQAHEKNMRLVSIINHNVPRNLLGDPQRLRQVITNLVSNAIKFSHNGNIVVRAISLGEMDNQIEIKISVADSGIGLTEEQQQNLFSAFAKVDNSDSRFQGGTGLGLAIAKGLVDRMKGEIGVESQYQKGSTFWFTARLGIDRQRISQSPFVNSLYGLNALVFDSNAVCRMEVTHMLSNWGVSFVEESNFNNIPNVIAANHQDRPTDLLILDAYTEENNFDRERLLTGIHRIRMTFKIPAIVLAPPAIQRILQDDMAGLNAQIVVRPIVHNQLHQAMCSMLNISNRHPGSTPISIENNLASPKHIGIRILVVDDNPANLKLVCEFLRGLGVDAKATSSGYEALDLAEKETFDMILMDVQMPGMDGYETTKLLRSREKETRTPIVALTAHAINEQKTQLLLAGMDDFLSKPVAEEDLQRLIERWVTPRITEENESSATPDPEIATSPVIAGESSSFEFTEKPSRSVFDWSESMRLAKNKPDLATDMLKMLLESLPETAKKIAQTMDDQDWQAMLEVAHKLHGGCCYCGVPALRKASKELEIALHNKEYSSIDDLINRLLQEIRAVLSWSEEHDIDVLFADYDD